MLLKSHKVFSAFPIFIIIISLVSSVLTQTPREPLGGRRAAARESQQTEEEKKAATEFEKKALALSDELIAEATSLRRADNRAYVLAVASDLLWDRDEGRARALAREAMDQVVVHLREAKEVVVDQRQELRKVSSNDAVYMRASALNRLEYGASTLRDAVFYILESHDANLALEFLRTTRPLSLEENEEKKRNLEKYLELGLAIRIAESDPQAALRLADAYRGDKTNKSLIKLWSVLLEKDPKAAASLSEKIIGDLKSWDLSDRDASQLIDSVLSFLGSRASETADTGNKPDTSNATRLDSTEARQAYRDALEIVVSAALEVTTAQFADFDKRSESLSLLQRVQWSLPDIEKHLPSRAPAVRAKLAQFAKELYVPPSPQRPSPEDILNMAQNTSADELIAIGAKSQDEDFKDLLFRNLAAKLIEQGDTARARQVLNDAGREDWVLAPYFESLERKERELAMKEGRLEEARKNVARLRWTEERALAWIEIAGKAEADRDQKMRRASLAEAGIVLGDQMETHAQVAAQLQLAAASLDLDPDRSFEVLGSTIDRLNTVLNAAMTVASFNQKALTPDGVVAVREDKDGEISLYDFVAFTDLMDQHLLAFARKDFNRTALALKRLQVDVIRLRTCLLLLDRIFRDEPSQDDNRLPIDLRRRTRLK